MPSDAPFNRDPFDSGYRAALLGCLRLLFAPDSPEQERQWLAGYDEARADMGAGLREPIGAGGVPFVQA